MSDFTLVIGNKNYSSWSLRPWLLLRHLALPFEEVQILLDQPDTAAKIAQFSGAGRVPVLKHGALAIWDSMAIAEYACEIAGRGWPQEPGARAIARSISAEMHSGFGALRSQWPMNIRATRQTPMTPELQKDIARVDSLWSQCRGRHAAHGPWLFGDYCVADAMYAPVALRFRTYGAKLSEPARAYSETVLQDAPLQQWMQDALREPWRIEHDEAGVPA